MWQNYYTATSIDEAMSLLAQHQTKARIVAGATDLLIELDRNTRKGVDTLIDISRIAGQAEITCADGMIHIGCLVTHAKACTSPLIQKHALPLAQACWEVGAPQIRNRATIAGNLITASPANDTITPLMALDATVTLHSVRGTRQVALNQFYTGVRKTVMQPDELLTRISFPALQDNARGMFIKLGLRRAQAISVVNIAVIIKIKDAKPEAFEQSPVTSAHIALGCVAPTIVRAVHAEAFLLGKTLNEDAMTEAANRAQLSAMPIDDIRATAEYRTEMVKVMTQRALRAIASGQQRSTLPENPILLGGDENATLPITHHQPSLTTTINAREYTIHNPAAQHKTLLRLLREDCDLVGSKEGCAEGECGACTLFLDGAAVMACLVPAPRAHGASITTVEGIANDERLHPLQQAFVDEAAVQCGYCTPGFLMSGAKLLQENPRPTLAQVSEAISGNLCRCTGYYKILAAFEQTQNMQ